MSTSLVKQSLSLFDDDLIQHNTETKKKKKQKDPMKLISTKKKGVKKELKRLKAQSQSTSKSKKWPAKSNASGSSYEPVDYTESSVKAIKQLSNIKSAKKEITKAVFGYRQGKRHKKSAEKNKQEESTVFTDKDFEDFAKNFDFEKLQKQHSKKH